MTKQLNKLDDEYTYIPEAAGPTANSNKEQLIECSLQLTVGIGGTSWAVDELQL